MSSHPLLSVIVPAYNAERFLGAALESIFAQTYRPIETIVIDDGSTDGTANVARAFPDVRYAFQAHAGIGAALNHGIALAAGAYFSFLDADDLWTENKLTRQMECFADDTALDMVFGRVQQFRVDPATGARHISEPQVAYFKGALLISRTAFFRVGLFDTQWQIGDFIEWSTRARELNLRSEMLEDVVLKRRIHDNNMGIRERGQRKAYLHILKRALDRRQTDEAIG